MNGNLYILMKVKISTKPYLGNPSEKKQNCDDSRGGQRSKGCEGGFSCRGGRASGVGRWAGRC